MAQFPEGIPVPRAARSPVPASHGLDVVRPTVGAEEVGTVEADRLHGTILPDPSYRLELGAAEVHQEDKDPRLQGQDGVRGAAAAVPAEDRPGLAKVYSNSAQMAESERPRPGWDLQEERGQVEDTEIENDDRDFGG